MKNFLAKKLKKIGPESKILANIIVGVVFFLVLIGAAFRISYVFGAVFVIGFVLAIYNNDLRKKPWKPLAIFTGGLIIRLAINLFFEPVIKSETSFDLTISALIFLSLLLFGWKIKKN